MTAMDKIVSDTADDPIVPLFERWKGTQAFLVRVLDDEQVSHADDPVVIEAYDKRSELERKLRSMTPTTVQGLNCLVELLWEAHGPCFLMGSENWNEQMEQPEMQLLWRVRSGAHHLAEAESKA